MALQKVSDKRFGSNGIGLGESIPIDHPHLFGFDKLLYALSVFGANGKIILNDYHTAVNAEALVGILGFKDVDDVIHKVHETELGLFGSMPPLSVPVGTADNVHRILFVTHFLSSLFAFCVRKQVFFPVRQNNRKATFPMRNIRTYYKEKLC